MNIKVSYYNEAVLEEVEFLPKKLLAKYTAIIDHMVENGPYSAMPYTKPMGSGLFEIRLIGQELSARVFYCFSTNHSMVILHTFIKKSQKTPKKELDLALKRLKEVRHHEL